MQNISSNRFRLVQNIDGFYETNYDYTQLTFSE